MHLLEPTRGMHLQQLALELTATELGVVLVPTARRRSHLVEIKDAQMADEAGREDAARSEGRHDIVAHHVAPSPSRSFPIAMRKLCWNGSDVEDGKAAATAP